MKQKSWVILGATVAVLLLVWLAAAPLFAFQDLAKAARAGDRAKLEALVDFAALRADLKDQLITRLNGRLSKARDNPFGALGALLAPSVVDQVVDAVVTPDGVAAIVRSGRAPLSDLSDGKSALPPPAETAPPAPAGAKPKAETRFAYVGLNRFQATTLSNDGSRARLGWVLERRGLGWKLVGIELPPGQ